MQVLTKEKAPRYRRPEGATSYLLASPRTSQAKHLTTLPPKSWFGGNNLVRALEHGQALRDLGAAVYEFDTVAMYGNDVSRIEQQKRASQGERNVERFFKTKRQPEGNDKSADDQGA